MIVQNQILSTEELTVVSEYKSALPSAGAYQSEAELEAGFIKQLVSLGYEYLKDVKTEESLRANLRKQIERLNSMTFSNNEWDRFLTRYLLPADGGVERKTALIQVNHIQSFERDSGEVAYLRLIDKSMIHNNKLQVINQFRDTAYGDNVRYDVTVLVNGFPLVHVELKRRDVELKNAFKQIRDYRMAGLYEYVQIFVISNGKYTKYYSNTARRDIELKKAGDNFDFTNFWADSKNRLIEDIEDFTVTFFASHTLLNLLTRYCVFTADRRLMVMRPYQIAAVESIIRRIKCTESSDKSGTHRGGYIWHTTGTGKTLTSYKAAQIAAQLQLSNPIKKVFFVVDRRDLDDQTVLEYNRYEKNSVNHTESTSSLKRQIEDPDRKIIVTTIQKLYSFISRNAGHTVYKSHVVIIFDECHRTQFGDMHRAITRSFKNYHIFGFTGTPIKKENASSANRLENTSADIFGDVLHTYTIVNAINEKNVLKFSVENYSTFKAGKMVKDKRVAAIDTSAVLESDKRVSAVVGSILSNFALKTKRGVVYKYDGRSCNGYGSLFAVASIPSAIDYYKEFQRQLSEHNPMELKVASIFSYSPDKEDPDESSDCSKLSNEEKTSLDSIVRDYNETFGTSFDTTSDGFQQYYKDVSRRMKRREIDILIVVDMFLTGFDAHVLNTLWCDKNLNQHRLIQAFSRTNRVFNVWKSEGNIVCFRNLKEATDEALKLFSEQGSNPSIALKRPYEDYYNGYTDGDIKEQGYATRVAEILRLFPLNTQFKGDKERKEFLKAYGEFLRLKNDLEVFEEFADNKILTEREFQNYRSMYTETASEVKKSPDKESVADDVVIEVELINCFDVDVDYILNLVSKEVKNGQALKQKSDSTEEKTASIEANIVEKITQAIDSNTELKSKKRLLLTFVDFINKKARTTDNVNVNSEWEGFIVKQRASDLQDVIVSESLNATETMRYVKMALGVGYLALEGSEFADLLPKISRAGGARQAKKEAVRNKLSEFFDKYKDIKIPWID